MSKILKSDHEVICWAIAPYSDLRRQFHSLTQRERHDVVERLLDTEAAHEAVRKAIAWVKRERRKREKRQKEQ